MCASLPSVPDRRTPAAAGAGPGGPTLTNGSADRTVGGCRRRGTFARSTDPSSRDEFARRLAGQPDDAARGTGHVHRGLEQAPQTFLEPEMRQPGQREEIGGAGVRAL